MVIRTPMEFATRVRKIFASASLRLLRLATVNINTHVIRYAKRHLQTGAEIAVIPRCSARRCAQWALVEDNVLSRTFGCKLRRIKIGSLAKHRSRRVRLRGLL